MTAGAWFGLLRQHGFAVSPGRRSRAALLSLLSLMNSSLSTLSDLRFGASPVGVHDGRPPVIILGHWRTGTTAIHELLATHPDHVSPSTYQVTAPSHFLISEKWLAPIVRRLLPSDRGFDDMRLEAGAPQEDEFAINALGLPSPLTFFGYAKNFHEQHGERAIVAALDDHDDAFGSSWAKFLAAVQSTAPRARLVIKSPAHVARIQLILRHFPDARFVHVVRHPYEVFRSTHRMMSRMIAAQGFQPETAQAEWLDDVILATLPTLYERFWRDEHLIPAANQILVRNEDLRINPERVLANIHDELGLAPVDANSPATREILSYVAGQRVSHYEMDEDERGKIASAWAEYAERYDYSL